MSETCCAATNISSRESRLVSAGRIRWRFRDCVSYADLAPILDNPELCLENRDNVLKDSPEATITRVRSASADQTWILRRLNYGRVLHRLRDLFRPSRAWRAFQGGLMLARAGIATPEPIAVADVRRWGLPLHAYLLTSEVPGGRTLGMLFRAGKRLPRPAVLALADLLADLHSKGFSHRDLKWSNVVFDSELKPYLIDLDALRRHRRISLGRAISDLARLARQSLPHPAVLKFSGARFVKQYCRRRGLEDAYREVALAILAETRKRFTA